MCCLDRQFALGRDQYRVYASSAGRSILVVPIEFSPKIADAVGGTPRLFRADLVLTGVLFERQLEARISFTTDHFTTRLAASTIWRTAIAWRNGLQGRPPSEFLARTSDAPLDIGAASVQKGAEQRH
jgi:hypothetical protein